MIKDLEESCLAYFDQEKINRKLKDLLLIMIIIKYFNEYFSI